MNGASPRPVSRSRRQGSAYGNDSYSYGNPTGSLYRRDSSLSSVSGMSDVEMAHDEVFAGPMSESIPSSVTGFAHRRSRSDSIASFTYFHEEDDSPEWSEDQAVVDDEDSVGDAGRPTNSSYQYDLEAGLISPKRRKSSGYSKVSPEEPLLLRRGSSKSEASNFQRGVRLSQKIYVASEDLTIVVAGFRTRTVGSALHKTICTLSLGLGYLIFRWLPLWKVRLVGSPVPLKDCDWVVIEVSFLNTDDNFKQ